MAKKKKARKAPPPKQAPLLQRVKTWLVNALRPKKWHFNILLLLFCSLLFTLLAEWISKADPTVDAWTLKSLAQSFGGAVEWAFTNLVAYLMASLTVFLLSLFIYALSNSTALSLCLPGIVYCCLSAANYFKLITRNEPLLPWDFSLIGAAAEFAGSVGLEFTPHIFIAIGGVLLFTLGALLANRRWGKGERRLLPVLRARTVSRLIAAAVVLVLIIGLFFGFYINTGWRRAWGISVNTWNQTKDYSNHGVLNMLAINTRYTLVEKPAGYSESAIDELKADILDKAESGGTLDKLDGKQEVTPNIILVMMEAFGDADLLKNFTYSEDVTPVSDWLEENCVSGSLMTNIFGGGTSITEFMALTGMTTSFLPPGSTPYQQFLNDPTPAYPAFLRDTFGYETVAIHPYGSTYWNRKVAYPNMGIDTFLSRDNCFKGAERCRKCNYVTDEAVMQQIIATYQDYEAAGDAPLFVHAVTIANHQGYHLEDYTDEERVSITSTEELSEDLRIAFESYVTGLRDNDLAMQTLIDYFSGVEEPTIILFFGDHWGKTGTVDEAFVPAGLFDEGTLYSSHENIRRAYSVPFYVWDNYLGLHEQVPNLSAYQLIPMLTDLYGLDRPIYFEYLSQQLSVFRGHYSNTVLDTEGVASGKKNSAIKKALSNMELLQYDLLFGKNYLNK